MRDVYFKKVVFVIPLCLQFKGNIQRRISETSDYGPLLKTEVANDTYTKTCSIHYRNSQKEVDVSPLLFSWLKHPIDISILLY